MEISSLELESKLASDLNYQLNEEWPEIGDFEKEKYGISVPRPIGVLINGIVVGGLSFTNYRAPNSDEIVVWVNAVLVQPDFRRKGIASKLILSAQSSAQKLFALTDIPALYTKLGWQIVSQDSNGVVVQYVKIT